MTEATPITDFQREDISIEEYAAEGDQFVQDDDALVNWNLRKAALEDYEEALVAEQCKKIVAAIQRRRAAREYRFQNQIEAHARNVIRERGSGDKRKSVDYLHGRVQFRAIGEKLIVRHVDLFREWFESQPADIRADLQDCWKIELARITPLRDYYESTGEIPPGVEVIPAGDKMTIQHKAIAPTTGD